MPSYSLVNEKLLEVTMAGEEIFARRGSMIAYRGEVKFARSILTGGGIQSLAARTVSGEGLSMMTARGRGSVLYGQDGRFVTVLSVKNETLYVESDSVLAFDSRLRPGTMFLGNQGGVQGVLRGAVSGQGLFCTTLQGTGEVAILSDGNAIGIPVSQTEPVHVDPDAYIGHIGELRSRIVTDVGWKTLVGQTSGESYQVQFSGQGTVYIQASER